MSAARIELPDFMSPRLVERTYGRAMELQRQCKNAFWKGGYAARKWRERGLRMAIDRNPRLLLFLEKAAEHLRVCNDEQASRVTDAGFTKTDFSEYALFREAYIKATEPSRDESAMHQIFCWIYAAAAEALGD